MGKDHPNVEPYVVSRVRALESILIEKGLLSEDAVDAVVQRYEKDTGPLLGALAVARAWLDPDYRTRLIDDAPAAIAELGGSAEELRVVANEDGVHNLVVCTLCSCYPWSIMGLPPKWYKEPAYRSRAVVEPAAVIAEFGLTLSDATEIRVWDSSAELRYMVLPQRPGGSEGMDEEALAALVTRDSMIGVAQPTVPARVV
ncbi:MAG: nitrile hydratase subunit alpha [Chloroflexi bacterium]|nr:nitrile hydratase subunit alpha [Chloroflexota bacterium]